MLAAVKQLKVGVTTKREYAVIMAPTLRHAQPITSGSTNGRDLVVDGAGYIEAFPEWWDPVLRALSDHLHESLEKFTIFNPPTFFITPTFEDGTLRELAVREWWGNGHPGGGSAIFFAGSPAAYFRDQHVLASGGYFLRQSYLADNVMYSSTVMLDDRATSEERSRALDFRFECFTSLIVCADGTRILNPAPRRTSQKD